MGQLRISGWFTGTESSIEHIVYDGAEALSLTPAQLEAWGGWHQGGGGADELVYASEYSDRAFGGGGDDLIFTGNGADRISGGKGDDELYGGDGNDIYYYAAGDGYDSIVEASGFDEIRFGPGISATDLVISLEYSGLVVTLASGRIDIAGGSRADPGIEQLRFADGDSLSVAALLGPEPMAPEDVEPPASDGGSSGGSTPGATADGDNGGGGVARSPLVETIPVSPIQVVSMSSESPAYFLDATALALPSGLPQSAFQALDYESSGAQSADAPGGSAGATLDLETLLEAVRAFDAAPTAASTAGRVTAEPPPESDAAPAITSWALTNALLEFHLSRPDSGGSTDGTADSFDGGAILARIGTGSGALPVGFSAFGLAAPRLETFSGLQEGLARLG